MKKWELYQQDTASFFQLIGLDSTVEAKVQGVRGNHDVDVFVKGSFYGVGFIWIIECKAWQTNIPKEKVMALAAIVDDIGADRGFLLSEVGFQSGAIRQAIKRNITLTSLQDLRETIEANMGEQVLANLAWRAARAKKEFWSRHYEGGKYLTEILISPHWFYLDYLSEVFHAVSRQSYPIVYMFNSAENIELSASNFEEIVSGVEAVVAEAEKYLAKQDSAETVLDDEPPTQR